MKKEIELAQSIVGFNRFHQYGLSHSAITMLNQGEAISKAYVYMNFETYQKILAIRVAYHELADEKSAKFKDANKWGHFSNISAIEVKLRLLWGMHATDIFKHVNAYEKFRSHNFWDLYMERNNKIIPNPIMAWDILHEWEAEGRTHLYVANLQKYFDNNVNLYKLAPLLPAMRHFGYWTDKHEEAIVQSMATIDANMKQRYFAHQSFNSVPMRSKSIMSFVKETINSGDYWTLILADWKNDFYLPRVQSIVQAFVVDYRLARDNKFRHLDRKINVMPGDASHVMKYLKELHNEDLWALILNTHTQCDCIENLSSSVYDYFQFVMNKDNHLEQEVGLMF